MILWILAIVLMGSLGLVGYYQGALRAGVSFVGLLFASILAIPLSPLIKPLLRLIGVDHPVSLALFAPLIIYLIILVGFKSAALALHKKVETRYKYKASDTERMLYERMSQRVGIGMGMANAFIYLILISVVGYVLGYFTVQVSTSESSSFPVKIANQFARDLQDTGMSKAIASFVPADEIFYDTVDIIGDLYSNPKLSRRLATYPVFYSMAEQTQFQSLAKDTNFVQKFWLKEPRPTLGEFLHHEKIQPLVDNVDFLTNVLGMLNNDLKDFKGYLETGKSPKYDSEIILGEWYYDFARSLKLARRAKLGMSVVEIKKVRQLLGVFTNSVIKAYVDNRLTFKVAANSGSVAQVINGKWSKSSEEKYTISFVVNKQEVEVPTVMERGLLTIRQGNFALVFVR